MGPTIVLEYGARVSDIWWRPCCAQKAASLSAKVQNPEHIMKPLLACGKPQEIDMILPLYGILILHLPPLTEESPRVPR